MADFNEIFMGDDEMFVPFDDVFVESMYVDDEEYIHDPDTTIDVYEFMDY